MSAPALLLPARDASSYLAVDEIPCSRTTVANTSESTKCTLQHRESLGDEVVDHGSTETNTKLVCRIAIFFER